MAEVASSKRSGNQYRVRGVSCSVRLDYRWTALVSRNCKGDNAPSLVVEEARPSVIAQDCKRK